MPLVVMAGTGKVIGGNGCLEAMVELGFAAVDVVEFEGSEVRALALAIALNRTGKTSVFDDEVLARQLAALPAELLEATGFNQTEMDEVLARLVAAVGLQPEPAPIKSPPALPRKPPLSPLEKTDFTRALTELCRTHALGIEGGQIWEMDPDWIAPDSDVVAEYALAADGQLVRTFEI